MSTTTRPAGTTSTVIRVVNAGYRMGYSGADHLLPGYHHSGMLSATYRSVAEVQASLDWRTREPVPAYATVEVVRVTETPTGETRFERCGLPSQDRWVPVTVRREEVVERLTLRARGLSAERRAERDAADERAAAKRQAEWGRWEAERPAREAAAREAEARRQARRDEYRPLYEAAMARVPLNRHGRPNGDGVREVESAYRKACGEKGWAWGQADLDFGLLRLRRLAAGE